MNVTAQTVADLMTASEELATALYAAHAQGDSTERHIIRGFLSLADNVAKALTAIDGAERVDEAG